MGKSKVDSHHGRMSIAVVSHSQAANLLTYRAQVFFFEIRLNEVKKGVE